jgi:integrase
MDFSVAHDRCSRPKPEASRERLPTDDEIERICSALGFDRGGAEVATDTKSHVVAVMLLFAIETAMRASEICQLEPHWVTGKTARLPALVTKTRTKRDVPLSKRALELLEGLPPALDGGTLFGITTEIRDALFRKATKPAAVEGLIFHHTRHLAITWLSKKFDVLALARMVGRWDLRQLQVYYNESAEDIAGRLD